jgi:transposase-like protein
MIVIPCPHCASRDCIKFGRNESGTARCRCHACLKTFTLDPKSRAMTPEKEERILASLRERISQRGIARSQRVSRLTIRNIRKKTQLG